MRFMFHQMTSAAQLVSSFRALRSALLIYGCLVCNQSLCAAVVHVFLVSLVLYKCHCCDTLIRRHLLLLGILARIFSDARELSEVDPDYQCINATLKTQRGAHFFAAAPVSFVRSNIAWTGASIFSALKVFVYLSIRSQRIMVC